MSKPSSSSTPSAPKFKSGQRVEIRSGDPGFRGPWYTAVVLRRDKLNPNHYRVQYEKLFEDESERDPLQQTLDCGKLRPALPVDKTNKISFKLGDEVDTYHSDGWWEGTIASARPDGKFVVSFRSLKEEQQTVFGEKDLRLRMDWIDGKWQLPFQQISSEETESRPIEAIKRQRFEHAKVNNVPPGESIKVVRGKRLSVSEEHSENSKFRTIWTTTSNVAKESSAETTETRPYKVPKCTESDRVKVNNASGKGEPVKIAKEKKFSASAEHSNNSEFPTKTKKTTLKEMKFDSGMKVEVTSDEEGFKGTWYLAKIIEPSGKDKYLVEYETLKNEAETEFLREDVRAGYIRPRQPEFVIVDGLKLTDKVDAYYNDGWWVGVVVKVMTDSRYKVYFNESKEHIVFKEHYLRLHKDWSYGDWVDP